MSPEPSPSSVLIVTPVYNDWLALGCLLSALERVGEEHHLWFHILVVDDASTRPPDPLPGPGARVRSVHLVHLTRNVGHQRAIAIGLVVAHERQLGLPIIVMDCDGEDRPEDIPRLLAEQEHFPHGIIFARRSRRRETLAFKTFYWLFKIIFRLLTGKHLNFGNFCLIPASLLERVIYLQEIWNHFAAGLLHARLPWTSIPTHRGRRYVGSSHMNWMALILHGLSAISVYIEVVYVRLIFSTLALLGLVGLGFLMLLYIRYLTPLAIPGWATNVAIGLTLIASQAFLFLTLLSFLILSYRSAKMFLPAKDYRDYILEERFEA